MNQLQKALQINALFSGLSGILLVVTHNRVASLFDTPNSALFQMIGAALIYFSLTIIYEIKHQNLLRVLFIIVQDSLWVIGSVILLILQPFDISMTGNGVIATVALIVLLLAINQTNALAQKDSIASTGIKLLTFERTVNASKASVWKVISDVANYNEVAPNVDDVKIISGEGKGMVRSCSHGKDSWTETCSIWEQEKKYAFEVNTDAPDYPYPFKYLKGNWNVEAIDNSQTRVIMLFEFEYKRIFQNWLLHPILKWKFSKTAKDLLDNWHRQIENE